MTYHFYARYILTMTGGGSVGMPGTSGWMPGMSGGMPGISDCMPGVSGGMPGISCGMPGLSGGVLGGVGIDKLGISNDVVYGVLGEFQMVY